MTIESQLMRLGLFDARVPRYTSYPTAPHFAGGVGPETFAQWIEAIPAHSEISLYMHVPFCRRLCWFCACRTQGTSSDTPVLAYAQVLKAEIALLQRHLAPGVKLSRLHWGGGTPTLLPADTMRDLAETVFNAVPLAEGGEFSVEIDPNEVDAERLTPDLVRCFGDRRFARVIDACVVREDVEGAEEADGLGEVGVADEMLGTEELAGKINGVALAGGFHASCHERKASLTPCSRTMFFREWR